MFRLGYQFSYLIDQSDFPKRSSHWGKISTKIRKFNSGQKLYCFSPSVRFLVTDESLILKKCATMEKLILPWDGERSEQAIKKMIEQSLSVLVGKKFLDEFHL
jgi:hypothetical protein